MAEADAVIIATDWPQFRGLDELLEKRIKNDTSWTDGGCSERLRPLAQAGFKIITVGSPTA